MTAGRFFHGDGGCLKGVICKNPVISVLKTNCGEPEQTLTAANGCYWWTERSAVHIGRSARRGSVDVYTAGTAASDRDRLGLTG